MHIIRSLIFILATTTLNAEIVIEGKNRTLELSVTSTLSVPSDNPIRLKDITITGVEQNRIICMSTTSKLILENAHLVIDNNVSFTQGIIEIKGKCSISTTTTFDATFTYSGHRIEIDSASTLEIRGPNLTFNCQPDSGLRRPIFFYDQSSVLNVNNATFKNGNRFNGILFLSGKLKIDGSSTLDSVNTVTNKGLILGGPRYNDAADCIFEASPNASLTIKNAGLVVRNNLESNFRTNNATLKFESNGRIVLQRQVQPLSGLELTSSTLDFVGTNSLNLNGNTLQIDANTIFQKTGIGDLTSGSASTISNFDQVFPPIAPQTPHFSPNGSYLIYSNQTSGALAQGFFVYTVSSTGAISTDTSMTWSSLDGQRSINTAFSPDGKFIASGGINVLGTALLSVISFDTLSPPSYTESPLAPLATAGLSTGVGYHTIAWSPDGRFLAVADGSSNLTLSIYQWNGSDLSRIGFIEESSSIDALEWSPNQKYIYTGTSSSINAYEFSENDRILRRQSSTTTITNVTNISISPDGMFLAAASTTDSVQIYSINASQTLTSLSLSIGIRQDALWSEDGNFLALCNSSGNETISKFNGTSLTTLINQELSSSSNGGLAFSPDAYFIAASTLSVPNKISSFSLPKSSLEAKIEVENGIIKLAQDFTLFSGKMRFS